MSQPGAVVFHLLLGIGSFLAVSTGIRSLMAGPEESVVTAKLEYFQEHASEYDAVYVGSSGIFRHLVPDIIDEALTKRGYPMRSFNLGGPGMFAFETDYVLRQVLDTPGHRLKVVVVEPLPWDPVIAEDNLHTERSIDWHTLRLTLHAMESSIRMEGSWSDRADLLRTHLRLYCWRRSNYGQGPRLVKDLFGWNRSPPQISREAIQENRGYQALEGAFRAADPEKAAKYRNRKLSLQRNPEPYRERIVALRSMEQVLPELDRINLRAHQSQQDSIRAAGARPVYMLSPVSQPELAAVALDRAGYLPVYLAFNKPREYGQFYALEDRFDMEHLTRPGAVKLSQLFAERLADHWDESAD